MDIESSKTNLAHVYVKGARTNIRLLDVRLEGTGMIAEGKPLVIIDDSSYGNTMNGVFGHTHVQADLNRNPGINFMTAKTVGLDPVPHNIYWNAAFAGFNPTSREMAGWELPEGSNWNITYADQSEELFASHNVISIDYQNPGQTFKLKADKTPRSPAHSFVTFGVYARSFVAGTISAAMRYESGNIISSRTHSGSGEWEFIGMSALYHQTMPYFYFSITGNVELTAPTFVYGQTPATPGASLMSSSGAQMAGTLSLGLVSAYPPAPSSPNPTYWVLPKNQGNLFQVKGTPGHTIARLSYSTADRFPKGTVVTLLFEEAGTTVKDSGYIKLKEGTNFVSKAHSSIMLVSGGSASWTEVSRNE